MLGQAAICGGVGDNGIVDLPEPDHIVLRAGPGLPDGFMPPDMDGRWYDRASFPIRGSAEQPHLRQAGSPAVAVPTGRFEIRDDGAVAEVWEFQV